MKIHATCGISVSPVVIEKGVSKDITINEAYFRFDGENITPDGEYTIKRSGDAGEVIIAATGMSGKDILNGGSTTDTISNSATYTLSITHLGTEFKKTASVSAYYPMYFGGSNVESLDKDKLNAIFNEATTIGTAKEVSGVGVFTKQSISGSPSGTHTFEVNDNQYIYLLVPYTMTINTVKSGGFDVPMSVPVSELTGTDKGTYKVYRSASQVNGGNKVLVVS